MSDTGAPLFVTTETIIASALRDGVSHTDVHPAAASQMPLVREVEFVGDYERPDGSVFASGKRTRLHADEWLDLVRGGRAVLVPRGEANLQ